MGSRKDWNQKRRFEFKLIKLSQKASTFVAEYYSLFLASPKDGLCHFLVLASKDAIINKQRVENPSTDLWLAYFGQR
jgi:hypothetical protein